ncbi:MAG TPA: response regulator [Verrucomicrobiae bacterium]|nr:response regulator [Verrucomicrobiae bacterium]
MTPKILVVDDEPYMHVLMKHHLDRAGFETLKAVNGREAVSAASRDHPAAIVMDFMMEEMDGLTALKVLKADDATKDIPVIIVTANGHILTRQEAESSGAVLFLTKPFSPAKLMHEIRRLVPEPPGEPSLVPG